MSILVTYLCLDGRLVEGRETDLFQHSRKLLFTERDRKGSVNDRRSGDGQQE